MKHIFLAIEHLDKHQIMHRDIKTTNLVFNDKKSQLLKLVDFGLA